MSLTVLIVEDNYVSQVGLGAWLGRHRDLTIRPADTVAAAAAVLLDGSPPDVILLDLDLPDESGESLFGAIAACNPIPRVVIVSGTNDAGRLARAVATAPGTAVAIPKPYYGDDLLAAIRGVSP